MIGRVALYLVMSAVTALTPALLGYAVIGSATGSGDLGVLGAVAAAGLMLWLTGEARIDIIRKGVLP